MDDRTYRCSFSLPASLALEISQTARTLGVSQSALVAHILASPLAQLALYLSYGADVEQDSAADGGRVLRLRGESRDVVEKLISEAVAASMQAGQAPLL